MSGLICLQGGAEFGTSCIDMDLEVLARSPAGAVVVVAGAASPGREHSIATRNAARHYSKLTDREVLGAPDPRNDLDGAMSALDGAGLVVLPGGSPRRLLDVLELGIGQRLRELHGTGCSLSGASAGAMVLCSHTMVPGEGMTRGLGLVDGIAIPHFDGTDWWDLDLPDEVARWGLPECGGILVTDESIEPIGSGEAMRLIDGVASRLL